MLEAFMPQGNTQLIAVSSAAASIQLTGNTMGARLICVGTGPIYFAASQSSGVTAALPTTSTPATGVPMLGNTVESFNLGNNCWLSAVSSAGGSASLFVTPGFGV